MTEVVLIRHGESIDNINDVWSGKSNCHLTENGILSAQKLGKKLKNDFDLIYCSPLTRTKETIQALLPNTQVIYDKRIEEIAELSKEEIEEKDVVDYVEFSNAKNEYFKEYIEIEKNILLTFKKIHFEKQVREYSIGIKSQIEENLEKEIQMKNKWEKVKSNIEDMYDPVIEHEENRIEELTEFLEEMKKELKI